MDKVLFFPQNETHIVNMLPIANKLSKTCNVVFISAASYFKQNIFGDSFPFEVFEVPGGGDNPFYLEGGLNKLKLVKEFKFNLNDKEFELDVDAVVVANDGAMQRVLLKKYPRAKSFLMLDGIISDYSFSISDLFSHSKNKANDLKDYVRRAARGVIARYISQLPYNEYIPSEIGSSKFDVAFTLSDYVSGVLKKRHSPIRQFYSFGLPRYSEMLEEKQYDINKKRVLIISQGYLWHNEYANDAYQHAEITQLMELLNDKGLCGEFEVVIRIHPRDDAARYEQYGVKLESSEININQSILESIVVFGFNSTVLLESAWYGKPTYSLLTSGQSWKFNRSFLGGGMLPVLKSVSEVAAVIDKLKSSESMPRSCVEAVFSPISQNTSDLISGKIVKVMRDE